MATVFFMASYMISLMVFWPMAVTASPAEVRAKYVLSIGGTIIANADVSLSNGDETYTLDLDARISGLGNLVARGSAAVSIRGTSGASALFGNDFSLKTSTPEGDSEVIVRFDKRNVSAFYSNPPPPPHFDQVPLQRSQLRNVNDMISPFIMKSQRFGPQICNRTLNIFTGTERLDLKLRYVASENATSPRTGYQGPVILCQMKYEPISGHYRSSEITGYLKDSERLLIWYAPVGDSDIAIPYRVLVGTSVGDLSLVLTGLER